MPAVTTLAVVGAGLALGGAATKTISGLKQRKEAKDAINNYERQDLSNAQEFRKISTLGADYAKEESSRLSSSVLNVLQSGGLRSFLGGLPQVTQQNNAVARQQQVQLDGQVLERERAIAQDNIRIRGLQERREQEDLGGLGQMYNVGNQNFYSGIGDIASIGGSLAMQGLGDFGGFTPKVSAVNTITPKSYSSLNG